MMTSGKQGTTLTLRGLRHAFSDRVVLNDVDLTVPAGTITALLGPSGCGKSTLLKAVAGLLHPQSGTIQFDDQVMCNGTHFEPPENRGLGMVFQDYALWPHMTVQDNVSFPLRMRRMVRAERERKVRDALAMVGLDEHAGRRPAQLSGGQQQRVALARAIVAQPRVLLFDEPLSNLDRNLREVLCREVGTLLGKLGITAIYVTHDHEEALALAHQIAHMELGRITRLSLAPFKDTQ